MKSHKNQVASRAEDVLRIQNQVLPDDMHRKTVEAWRETLSTVWWANGSQGILKSPSSVIVNLCIGSVPRAPYRPPSPNPCILLYTHTLLPNL